MTDRSLAQTGQLDCIVRFHDPRRLSELERCVFSLVGQRFRPINIVLVLQRFSPEEVAATEAALAPILQLPDAPTLTVVDWNGVQVRDARTHLLNAGVDAAQGRYLAFLDYDDVLFPEAYELLVGQLSKSGAAIAFASVQVMQIEVHQHFFYTTGTRAAPYKGETLADLFKNNFCPIHSYVIDRSQISGEILRFDTSLTIEEDYDLLLRICAGYPSDFSLIDTPVGYYYFKTDGSNTVATQCGLDGDKLALYQDVQARIQERKRTTFVSTPVQSALGLPYPREGLSILDAMRQLRFGSSGLRKLATLVGSR